MDLSISPTTVKIEIWAEHKSAWNIKSSVGIKVTHVPTGIEACCGDHRSQHKNKHQALQQLKVKIAAYAELMGLTSPQELPFVPMPITDTRQANATDVLKAYPGRHANPSRLDVWEAMKDSIINDDKGKT